MDKPYKKSRIMGEGNYKDPSEKLSSFKEDWEESLDGLEGKLIEGTEDNPFSLTEAEFNKLLEDSASEESVEFESSFYWRDSFEGEASEAMLISNDLFSFIKSSEKHIGKKVVGILPIDEKTVKLLFGGDVCIN